MQANTTTTETVPQPRETVSTTFLLPVEVYEALRSRAFHDRKSQVQIVIEALRSHLGIEPSATKAA
jgi:hypothetical protein